MNAEDIIGSKIDTWLAHPAAMVEDEFGVTPDAWQAEALEAFPHSPLLAMRACAGPGKTAVLAWLGWNFLVTRPYPYIGVGAHACFVDAMAALVLAGWINFKPSAGRRWAFTSPAKRSTSSATTTSARIKRGGALPESMELAAVLTQTTYTIQKDKLLLEPKEDMLSNWAVVNFPNVGMQLKFARQAKIPAGGTGRQYEGEITKGFFDRWVSVAGHW